MSESEKPHSAGKRETKNKTNKLLDEISDPYNYISKMMKNIKKGRSYRNGDQVNLPPQINLTISFGYDKSVKEKFDNDSNIKMWLDEVLIHMSTYYQHPSLQTTINLHVTYRFNDWYFSVICVNFQCLRIYSK